MEILDSEEKKARLSFLKKRRTVVAFLLWLLSMMLLIALFLAKKDIVKRNLEEARVKERLFDRNPTLLEGEKSAPVVATTKDDELGFENNFEASSSESVIAQDESTQEEQGEQDSQITQSESIELTEENSVEASLFFVRLDDDGNGSIELSKRRIEKSDSPMMSAINAVINGVSEEEENRGLMSLVPEDCALLGATVVDGVALLDFNDAFEYNNFGFQGTLFQLKQIVYTATAFPTVSSVQILINGEKCDYLGSEGVFIGEPLSRESF